MKTDTLTTCYECNEAPMTTGRVVCKRCLPIRSERLGKFKVGDKVEANGNKEATVTGYYDEGIVEVNLWDGAYLIGAIVTGEDEIKRLKA